MDFLSYLSQDKSTQPIGAVLVLNSTNLLQRALPYTDDPCFKEVRLYLDSDDDDAGTAATRKLFESAQTPSKFVDMRSFYEEYDDLNAWPLGQKV